MPANLGAVMRAIPREFLISFVLALATQIAFGGGRAGRAAISHGTAGRNVYASNRAAPGSSFSAAVQFLPSGTSPYLASRPSTITGAGTTHAVSDSGAVHAREFRGQNRMDVQEFIRPRSGIIDADADVGVAVSPNSAHKHSLSSGIQGDSHRRIKPKQIRQS
jgi:hypothetical protein